MKVIKKILDLLTAPERKRAGVLLCMMLTMALIDTIGVASIMPFMAVLASPGLVETNLFLKNSFTAANRFGIDTTEKFLFALGIVVFVLLLISLALKAITTYAQLRFTLMREYSIGKRLVEGYLYQSYSWFLSRNSADLGKTILSEVGTVIGNGVTPMMNLIAQGAVAIMLLAMLILVDPKLAFIVGLTLTLVYAIIIKSTGSLLARIGTERITMNKKRFTVVNEAFGAWKEVKVAGLEKLYINRFSDTAQAYANDQATASVISQLPRFALEAIAFGGIMLVVLTLMARSGGFANAVPIIALYSFAGYRLMPALQQIYAASTQLRFVEPAINALHAELIGLEPSPTAAKQHKIPFSNHVSLRHVNYSYPNTTQPAIKNLTLTILSKSTVGFVGVTGSGKTTTVDLILGLLDPQGGTVEVDNKLITKHNKRAWQRHIGYVPQNIYLADDTVAANIAFCKETQDIDQTAVERAAKIANLHDFVNNDLPHRYQTVIGERGVRLSGGQRQRIGIARALYSSPQLLIMDEATSALDNLTEQAVMEAVNKLNNEITIILIAHRLSTVKACDQIFLMENGELIAQGTFNELEQSNVKFREMVRKS